MYLLGLGHAATHWVAGTFYVLLPFMTKDLGLSYTQAGLLVSILHISSFFANFGSGAVVDVTGRKVIFQVISLGVGGVALLVFGFTGLYMVLCAMVVAPASNFIHFRPLSGKPGICSVHSCDRRQLGRYGGAVGGRSGDHVVVVAGVGNREFRAGICRDGDISVLLNAQGYSEAGWRGIRNRIQRLFVRARRVGAA